MYRGGGGDHRDEARVVMWSAIAHIRKLIRILRIGLESARIRIGSG